MDVSQPNNFARILYSYQENWDQLFEDMSAVSINETQTRRTIRQYAQRHYPVDPHTAVGLEVTGTLFKDKKSNDLVVATAHPAKFADVLEDVLQEPVKRPQSILDAMNKTNLSKTLSNEFEDLKDYLLNLSDSHQ